MTGHQLNTVNMINSSWIHFDLKKSLQSSPMSPKLHPYGLLFWGVEASMTRTVPYVFRTKDARIWIVKTAGFAKFWSLCSEGMEEQSMQITVAYSHNPILYWGLCCYVCLVAWWRWGGLGWAGDLPEYLGYVDYVNMGVTVEEQRFRPNWVHVRAWSIAQRAKVQDAGIYIGKQGLSRYRGTSIIVSSIYV